MSGKREGTELNSDSQALRIQSQILIKGEHLCTWCNLNTTEDGPGKQEETAEVKGKGEF